MTGCRVLLLAVVVLGVSAAVTQAMFIGDIQDQMKNYGLECYGVDDLNKLLNCFNVNLLGMGQNVNCSTPIDCPLLQKLHQCIDRQQLSDVCLYSVHNVLELLVGSEICNITSQFILDMCFDGTLILTYPAWSEWGAYQSCSVTCGHGMNSRSRQCVRQDQPEQPRAGCTGPTEQRQACRADVITCSAAQNQGHDSLMWTSLFLVLGLVLLIRP